MLRWAGNKSSLLPKIYPYFPDNIINYHEPYLGSGSVFLNLPLQPKNLYLNDINIYLISFFKTLFSDQKFDVWHLVDITQDKIEKTQNAHSPTTQYYLFREYFNTFKHTLCPTEKASFFLYFNELSHNGIWRENKKKGEFNVPLQHTELVSAKAPSIDRLLKIKDKFTNSNITFTNDNWLNQDLADNLTNSFFYIDSPYDILPDQKTILQYSGVPFNRNEQIIQARKVKQIHERNGKFCLSNAKTPFIESLYSEFNIETIETIRKIANQKRGNYKCDEVIIYN